MRASELVSLEGKLRLGELRSGSGSGSGRSLDRIERGVGV